MTLEYIDRGLAGDEKEVKSNLPADSKKARVVCSSTQRPESSMKTISNLVSAYARMVRCRVVSILQV